MDTKPDQIEGRPFCRPGAISLPPLPMPPLEPMDTIFSWLCWNVQGHLSEAADANGNLQDGRVEAMYHSILSRIWELHEDLVNRSGVFPGQRAGIVLPVSPVRAAEIMHESAGSCMARWFADVVRPAMSGASPDSERHTTLRRLWTQVLTSILNETVVEAHFFRDLTAKAPWPPGIRAEIERLLHRRRIRPTKAEGRRGFDETSTEAVIEDIIGDVYGRASYEKDYKLRDGKLALKVATLAGRVKEECIKRSKRARRTESLEAKIGGDEDLKLKDLIEDAREAKDAREASQMAKEVAALALKYLRDRKSEVQSKGRLAALNWLERQYTEGTPPSKKTVAAEFRVTPSTLNESLSNDQDDGELDLLQPLVQKWIA